jgi:hypothetical protein
MNKGRKNQGHRHEGHVNKEVGSTGWGHTWRKYSLPRLLWGDLNKNQGALVLIIRHGWWRLSLQEGETKSISLLVLQVEHPHILVLLPAG